MPEITFYNHDIDAVLKNLDAERTGLTSKEVKRRQGYYGINKLPEEKVAPWFAVLSGQFKSPLVAVLGVAALISYILHEPVDGSVILAAVVVQVVVGFIQEFRAQRSLAALKQIISLSARVIRDGREKTITAEDLVPGDIIQLQAGDKIPADVRLLETHDFEVNEAALTGESEPIQKNCKTLSLTTVTVGDQSNMAFTGTVATKGTAEGIVIATGTFTEIGKIAKLIKETKDETTPLQQKLTSFSKKISIVVVAMAVAIMIFGYVVEGDFAKMFTVAVAVAVSAIPEGLAVAVTIILAVGMQRILKRRALVRKLLAAETLGSTNVICTDKTGTLTEGNMQVTDIVTWAHDFSMHTQAPSSKMAGAENLLFALRLGMLCNDAKVQNIDDTISNWVISGNLTERALLLAGSQAGLHMKQLQKEAPRIDAIPFDSDIKYMATLHREAQGRMLYVKGAPEIVTAMCSKVQIDGHSTHFDKEKQHLFQKKFSELSKRGLRIIALAYKNTENLKKINPSDLSDLVFIGYVGIKDPLRKEAKATVAKCQRAGIQTVMITGDHKLTAQAIAKELGMKFEPKNVMEGKELDELGQHELNKRVMDIAVYARVTPHHKLRIVHAWQANGMVVAMTGDGINDSPAIKAADIGVALGSGTDVAKETADMVILDDNFDTIVAAVEEGRGIFDNIKKTVLYLLSDSFSEVILIVGAILLGLPIPITAAQILWINLIDDSFPSLAMTQEPKEPETMNEPPRGRKAEILDREVKVLIIIISLVTGVLNLGLFYYIYTSTGNVDLARTVIFLSLGIDSLLYMFSVRSMRKMIYQKSIFSNRWLIGAFFLGLLFQIIPIYIPFFQKYINTVPLDARIWGIVIGLSIVVLCVIEGIKFLFLHAFRKKNLPITVQA